MMESSLNHQADKPEEVDEQREDVSAAECSAVAPPQLSIMEDREHLQVYLRIRPFSSAESSRGESQDCVSVEHPDSVLLRPPCPSLSSRLSVDKSLPQMGQRFRFSQVFGPDTSQPQLFEGTVKDLVKDVLEGENSLVFTYGVTNAGKTFTFLGPEADAGILPRSLDLIFSNIQGRVFTETSVKPHRCREFSRLSRQQQLEEELFKRNLLRQAKESDRINISLLTPSHNTLLEDKISVEVEPHTKFSVWVSFCEIYNENIHDLLEAAPTGAAPRRAALRLSQDVKGNAFVKDLRWVQVSSSDEAFKVMKLGKKNQSFSSTRLNQLSSRSHSIFSIRVLKIEDTGTPRVHTVSELCLCDLAGSERCAKTQNKGERLKEAGNINTSLLILGKCINALRHNQQARLLQHVPFRESKLTHYLQSFFTGRGRACMIVNINPCASMYDETLNVLRFSAVAQKVVVLSQKPLPSKAQSSSCDSSLVSGADRTHPRSGRRSSLIGWESSLEDVQEDVDHEDKEEEDIMMEDTVDQNMMEDTVDQNLMEETIDQNLMEDTMDQSGNQDEDKILFSRQTHQRQVALLRQLQAQLQQERAEVLLTEARVREEVSREFTQLFSEMQSDYDERLVRERQILEEREERRLEIFKNLIEKMTEGGAEHDTQGRSLQPSDQRATGAARRHLASGQSSAADDQQGAASRPAGRRESPAERNELQEALSALQKEKKARLDVLSALQYQTLGKEEALASLEEERKAREEAFAAASELRRGRDELLASLRAERRESLAAAKRSGEEAQTSIGEEEEEEAQSLLETERKKTRELEEERESGRRLRQEVQDLSSRLEAAEQQARGEAEGAERARAQLHQIQEKDAEIQGLKLEAEELKQQLQTSGGRAEKLRDQVSELRADMSRQVEKNQMELEETHTRQAEELRKKLQEQEAMSQELRAKLESQERSSKQEANQVTERETPDPVTEQLKEKLGQQEETVQLLMAQLEEFKGSAASAEELKRLNSDLQAEVASLRGRLFNREEEQEDQGPETRAEPKRDVKQEEAQEKEAQETELHRKLQEKEVQEKELQKKLQEKEAQETELHRKLQEKEVQETELEKKLQEKEAQETELHKKLQEKEAQETELHRKLQEKEVQETELQKKLQEKEAQETELHRKLQEKEVQETELHKKLQETALHGKLQEKEVQETELHKKLQETELHRKLQEKEVQETELHKKLQEKEAQETELRGKLQEKDALVASLQKSLQEALEQREDDDIQAVQEARRREVERRRELLAVAHEAIAQKDEELEKRRDDIIRLKEDNKQDSEKVQSLSLQLQRTEEQASDLRDKLADYKKQVQQVQKEISAMREEEKTVRQKLSDCEKSRKQLQSDVANRDRTIQQLRLEQSCDTKADQTLELYQKSCKELEAKERVVEDMRAALTEQEETQTQMEEVLEEKLLEIQELSDEVEKLRGNVSQQEGGAGARVIAPSHDPDLNQANREAAQARDELKACVDKHQAEKKRWLEDKLSLIGQAKEAEDKRNQEMRKFVDDRERFARQQSHVEALSSQLAEKDESMERWRKERDALVSALEVQLHKLLSSQAEKDKLIQELRCCSTTGPQPECGDGGGGGGGDDGGSVAVAELQAALSEKEAEIQQLKETVEASSVTQTVGCESPATLTGRPQTETIKRKSEGRRDARASVSSQGSAGFLPCVLDQSEISTENGRTSRFPRPELEISFSPLQPNRMALRRQGEQSAVTVKISRSARKRKSAEMDKEEVETENRRNTRSKTTPKLTPHQEECSSPASHQDSGGSVRSRREGALQKIGDFLHSSPTLLGSKAKKMMSLVSGRLDVDPSSSSSSSSSSLSLRVKRSKKKLYRPEISAPMDMPSHPIISREVTEERESDHQIIRRRLRSRLVK